MTGIRVTAFAARWDALVAWLPAAGVPFVVAHRRPLCWGFAGLIHVLLVYLVLFGLTRPPAQPPAREIQLTMIGGQRVAKAKPLELTLVPPTDAPLVTPPEIEVDDTPSTAITTAPAKGGPGVTVPAEAIGETHGLPPLSAALLATMKSPLRLLLRVAEDGTIKDATVQASTGSAELDRVLATWVREHWRYRPALRDGIPVAVTTTALVPL